MRPMLALTLNSTFSEWLWSS